nr:terpene synthase [Ficus altissima]
MTTTLSTPWILPLPLKRRSITRNQGRSRLPSITIFSNFEVKRRKSAHYHPTIWETSHIESFVTPYTYESHAGQLEELKQITSRSLKTKKDPLLLLKLINSTQRLGLAYQFEDEIREAVSLVYQVETGNDLYTMAQRFRVLREHGLSVNSDVFNRFRGQDARFLDSLSSNVNGLLSLYEASYLGMPGEDVLEVAKSFTTEALKNSSNERMERFLAKQVQQSLEIPLYWRVPRVEARNFIDLYEMDPTKNPTLLKLAKLDYNLVQSVYQQELKELARWWRELGFKENLVFARDRLMENFLWAMGIVDEPHLSKCRVGLTKFVCILTAIDDIYDVYGSLSELECFTNAVKRWDIEAIEDLPLYMKICYLAMLNFGNDLIYDVLKTRGLDVSPFIKKEWINLCRSYLVEARWFYSGYTPTVEEYLETASISVGGHAGIVHACILGLDHTITKSSLDCFNHGAKLIQWSSLITRLSDDLGTSKDESKRGDVAKVVQCYMVEKGISEEEAINHTKELISQSWKMMNKEIISKNNSVPNSMVRMCVNMARTAQCIFQHGDGIGTSSGVTRDRLASLIVEPVPI